MPGTQQPQPQLSYVTLAVSDLERSLRFYRDGLALPPIKQTGELAFLDLGGVRLALYPQLEAETGQKPTNGPPTNTALSLNLPARDDVEQVLRRALAAGGTPVRAASEPAWGGYRAYVADPDGFIWELAWHPDYRFR